MSALQPFNVYSQQTGVFPPRAGAQVPMAPKSQYSYYLMTRQVPGPYVDRFTHTDTCHTETVVTLEGDYFITVGGKPVHQQAGDVLVIPPGVPHGPVTCTNPTGYRNLQIENTHPGCKSRPSVVTGNGGASAT